jgi:DNA-binding transcriptional MocR family regulator
MRAQLADALAEAATSGALKPGTRLPSERALARQLAVSRSTVVAAYETLRAAGLVDSRHGSGTYVATATSSGGADDDLNRLGTPVFRPLLADDNLDQSIISLALATVPGAPAIAEEMVKMADTVPALLEETGYWAAGLPALRRAIAALLSSEGLLTDASQVLVTTGAHQAISLCASLLVKPGDLVVVEDPTYPGCVDSFAAAGARFAAMPVDDQGADVNRLPAILRAEPPAAIYVMPSYQNPTGRALADHRRRQLAELTARTGVPIIEDNALAHARLSDTPPLPAVASYLPATGRDAPIITVGSLSKSLWGGLRVGWLRAPEPWFSRLARRKVASDLGSGVLDQAIAAGLLGRLPELAAQGSDLLRRRLASTEELLRLRLPTWTWEPPQGGGSLWVHLPSADTEAFARVALRHGVEIIGGAAFSPTDTCGDHLRLPFACDPGVMAEAVDRLAAAWAAYTTSALVTGAGTRRPAMPSRSPRIVV